ncbi:MAG: type II secretion system minor pseudopilin GspK [Nitrospirota bacterium]|nr:type II secretion system minor pseudopilin GspK [Nitrospirota bacterium]
MYGSNAQPRPGNAGRAGGDQRGIALIITLLAVTLMITLILELDFHTRMDLRGAGNFRDYSQASVLADSAAQAASVLLYVDTVESGSYDGMDEYWYLVAQMPMEAGGGTAHLLISDEDGKFDINTLKSDPDADGPPQPQTDIYRRMLQNVLNLEPEDVAPLVDSLLDWLDEDSDERGGGAEMSYYQALERPYPVANSRFRTLDELALVKGYTREIRARLGEYITVIEEPPGGVGSGNSGGTTSPVRPLKLNINTAPEELLRALDEEMPQGVVNDILRMRADEPFKTVDLGALLAVHGLGTDTRLINALKPLFVQQSNHFLVEATGMVGETQRTVRAMMGRVMRGNVLGKQRMEVLWWRVE